MLHVYLMLLLLINIISCTEKNQVTLPGLLEHLKDVVNWDTFGVHLLPAGEVVAVEKINRTWKGDVGDCKIALFRKYMEVGDRSWTTVVGALTKSGYRNIATDITQTLGL